MFHEFGKWTAVARAPFRDLLRRAATLATTRNPSGVVRPRARMLARVIGAARKRRVTRKRRSKLRPRVASERHSDYLRALCRGRADALSRPRASSADPRIPRHPMGVIHPPTRMIAEAIEAVP